jgi:NADPH:quinone reductase
MTNKFKQVLLSAYGAPEVLTLVEADVPQPKPGEVIIQTEAIGVNFSDTLRRRNQYFMPTPLPYVLGSEAVGEIIAVGEGVAAPYSLGARVLAILPFGGGYAECVAAQAQYCVPIPPHLDAKAATAIFVQGSTAQLMISQLAQDLKGKSVLVNAAAGGVGSLLVQLAKMGGAKVLAGSSSDEKLEAAKANGADVLINYSKPNWGVELKNQNGGNGVDIAFEMVGGEVYNETVKSLAPGGQLIIYGCASGIQGTIHPEYFVDENLSQIGFNLAHFITHQTAVWQEALGAVIGMVAQGQLNISTPHTFLLRDAAEAHLQIEARKTTGKVVLVPQ